MPEERRPERRAVPLPRRREPLLRPRRGAFSSASSSCLAARVAAGLALAETLAPAGLALAETSAVLPLFLTLRSAVRAPPTLLEDAGEGLDRDKLLEIVWTG